MEAIIQDPFSIYGDTKKFVIIVYRVLKKNVIVIVTTYDG